jgi:predicted CopG family antitoxin
MKNITISLNEEEYQSLLEKKGDESAYSYVKKLITSTSNTSTSNVIKQTAKTKHMEGVDVMDGSVEVINVDKHFCSNCVGIREFKDGKCINCKK